MSSASASATAPSSTLSADLASPPARPTRWSKASGASATPPSGPSEPARPRSGSSSARRTTVATSSSVSGSSRHTRIRDRSAELTSKYGFSVVAPTSVIVPSSTCGRSASCWALLKRWISSRNRTVRVRVERESLLRLGDRGAHVRDAGHDRRQRRELGTDLPGEEPGEAGLARAGRAPEDEGSEVATGDAPAERPALADEVLLADELVEAARAHPGGQRLALGRRLEQRLGPRADGASRAWHGPMVARRVARAGWDQAVRTDRSRSTGSRTTGRAGRRSATRR